MEMVEIHTYSTAQELADEVHDIPAVEGMPSGTRPLKKAADKHGDPHHGDGVGQVHGDVPQGDLLGAPEGGRLGLGGCPRLADAGHLVDVGVGEVLAEEAHAGEGDEGEEVQRHQQVIRHRGGGNQRCRRCRTSCAIAAKFTPPPM